MSAFSKSRDSYAALPAMRDASAAPTISASVGSCDDTAAAASTALP